MLHLFFVHSFATYHCALGVMTLENLDQRSCVLILSRSFQCPAADRKFRTAILPSFGTPNLNTIKRAIGGKRHLTKRNREISELTNGHEFICYTPHTYYDFLDLVIAHPQCQGFSYIEEGLTSYYQPGEIDSAYPPWTFSRRTTILRTLLFGTGLRKQVHFFRQDYLKAYGFSQDSFPGWDRREVLGLQWLLPELQLDQRPTHPPILVFDALVELRKTTSDALARAVEQLLAACQKAGVSKLCYKFHPSQEAASSMNALNTLFDRYRSVLELVELSREVSLESLFSIYEMPVFVFNSASGLYASLAGQQAYSLNPLILESEPSYRHTVDSLPEIYRALVRPMDEFQSPAKQTKS